MKLRYKIASGIFIFLAVAIASLAVVLGHTADCEPAPAVADDAELMKAIVYRCYGSPDVLEFADVEKPAPKDNEVLVKIQAAAVNPLDWHYMRGSPYFMRLGTGLGRPTETRLGVDFAGIVEAVGKDVMRFKPGDEVFGGWTGAFAEYLVVAEDRGLALKPANISFEQAASTAIAGLTALQALRDHGKLQPGQKVLINGASGGVGTFAVQIAKSMGAEVSGVCSTRNVEMVRSLGADHVFDYKQENYTESGQTFDVIVDMVGNHSLSANLDVLSDEGILFLVGGPSGDWIGPLIGPLKAAVMSLFVDQQMGMMLGHLRQDDMKVLADLMQAEKVTPVIDRRYRLSEVPTAIRYSEEGRARGKIIIDVQ
ncbi:MAG: NAD(P)-dependent alcohol dehydrogenase [Woeseiaceae bacterium]